MYRNQEFFYRMPYGGCSSSSSSSDQYQNQITLYNSNMNYFSNNEIWRQQNNFNMSFNEVYNEDLSLTAAVEIREQDENMIENFLKDNEKIENLKKEKDKEDTAFRIVDTRNMATDVYKLIKELKESLAELRENGDMTETEWRTKIEITEHKKLEINKVLDKLENVELLKKVKASLDKRKKKRLREKKQRALRKIEKQSANERRIELHARADAWIKDKQNIIEKEKQELSMRKDADIVLAEVRGKRNDARKFLAMLQELGNLRRIKVNIARARGENLSTAADKAFTNIIGDLFEKNQTAKLTKFFPLDLQIIILFPHMFQTNCLSSGRQWIVNTRSKNKD